MTGFLDEDDADATDEALEDVDATELVLYPGWYPELLQLLENCWAELVVGYWLIETLEVELDVDVVGAFDAWTDMELLMGGLELAVVTKLLKYSCSGEELLYALALDEVELGLLKPVKLDPRLKPAAAAAAAAVPL